MRLWGHGVALNGPPEAKHTERGEFANEVFKLDEYIPLNYSFNCTKWEFRLLMNIFYFVLYTTLSTRYCTRCVRFSIYWSVL